MKNITLGWVTHELTTLYFYQILTLDYRYLRLARPLFSRTLYVGQIGLFLRLVNIKFSFFVNLVKIQGFNIFGKSYIAQISFSWRVDYHILG